jgi:hypothetical protein
LRRIPIMRGLFIPRIGLFETVFSLVLKQMELPCNRS